MNHTILEKNNGCGEQVLSIQSEKLEEIFPNMAFVRQGLGNRGSPCQVIQEHLMKGLLLCVCRAASGGCCKPKGLIKEFLWRSDKADSRGRDAGPQTGCDPHTCLVELRRNVSGTVDTLALTRQSETLAHARGRQLDPWVSNHAARTEDACLHKCRKRNSRSCALTVSYNLYKCGEIKDEAKRHMCFDDRQTFGVARAV